MLKWLLILGSAFLAIYAMDHRWRERRRWKKLPSNDPVSDWYLDQRTGRVQSHYYGGV